MRLLKAFLTISFLSFSFPAFSYWTTYGACSYNCDSVLQACLSSYASCQKPEGHSGTLTRWAGTGDPCDVDNGGEGGAWDNEAQQCGTDETGPDSDGDGIPDDASWAPQADPDQDGVPNSEDADDDGDGIPDAEDIRPHAIPISYESDSTNPPFPGYVYVDEDGNVMEVVNDGACSPTLGICVAEVHDTGYDESDIYPDENADPVAYDPNATPQSQTPDSTVTEVQVSETNTYDGTIPVNTRTTESIRTNGERVTTETTTRTNADNSSTETVTTTTRSTNGTTTTTTTETEYDSDGNATSTRITGTSTATDGTGDEEGVPDAVSGGNTCQAPPVCQGDALACALIRQQWLERCPTYELGEFDDGIPDDESDLTFDSVMTDFRDRMQAAPVMEGLFEFFSIDDGGQCPVWSVSAWVFSITIDQQCDQRIPWGLITGMIIATALFGGARIAFT